MDSTLAQKFHDQIVSGARLCDYTTFRLGGACRGLIACQIPEQLELAVKSLADARLPFILIGGGSNLVVSDQGVDCYVLRYVTDKPLLEREGNDIIVSGSTSLDALALFSIEQGLAGLEYTSGIPGTVGGAVVGNAGAFGKQVGDVLKSVTLISKTGTRSKVGPEALGFTYRHSNLKERDEIVVAARFALQPGEREKFLEERAKILAIRHEKHPDLATHPCAGSFFRNVEPTSKAEKRQAAGWFLEQAGGKDLKIGGALIFEKHANIIVKGPQCTADDVYQLSCKMQQIVKEKFHFDLVREVRFVGKINSLPKNPSEMFW
ncbi:MAG: UDP-N-acetylenolpyruvoylglucosamine reductase [Omnitrophica WOR_2 bacterium RIFCSPHIGHO2_01_FULL_48_9]|nr:MAG: UDP-N-acetylenolpyruvoylglucosamine reductase [Omnitrophica WOR_2 bacterium RIFCSPHIGHO2_02_FULL_48_11]OGX33718.1 MAG: UDP-N-acetylenolpyruvoylglucosamine reductase [Omnitrophica WOR_2 bacterium RIFCSPHIGHO2_01_FULL_48_9]